MTKYNAIAVPMPATYMIQPNTTYSPLDNKLLRQAMNYAIDRKRYVESTIQGEDVPMSTPWRPNSPAYEAEQGRRLRLRPR